jgi:hypothetical protein
MTQLLSFQIYRTENINIAGTSYTLRFSSAGDGEEHILMITNEANKKSAKYHFSPDVEHDFEFFHGEKLEKAVLEMFRSDFDDNRI